MCRNHRVVPSLGLLAGVLAGFSAHAQQVIADGDERTPAAGDYWSAASDAAPVFHALNGGSIIPSGAVSLFQWGGGRPAVLAEGAGSRIVLDGGSIQTNGNDAHGISARSAASVHVSSMDISVEGRRSTGVSVDGGDVILENVGITTAESSGAGISVQDGSLQMRGGKITSNSDTAFVATGGTSLLEGVQVDLQGNSRTGILATGTSEVVLRNVRIVEKPAAPGSFFEPEGIVVRESARVALHGVEIVLSDQEKFFSPAGLSLADGGMAQVYASRIHAGGGVAARIYKGQLDIAGSELSGVIALDLNSGVGTVSGSQLSATYIAVDVRGDGSQLTLGNSAVSSSGGDAVSVNGSGHTVLVGESRLEAAAGVEGARSGTGLSISGERNTAKVESSFISGGNGVRSSSNNALEVRGSSLSALADSGVALWLEGGKATVHDSVLQASGHGATALLADGSGVGATPPTVDTVGSWITTEGDQASAVVARQGGTIRLDGSVVRTTGTDATGVKAGGTGEVVLHDTHVLTEGEGSWAAVINDGGRLQIDGGSLVSQQHGGAWIRSTRDAGLALGKGAVLYGGNGIAVQLDAAVAGRFDVALAEGARMQGDIVINPDDLAAGRVPQSELHVRLSEGSLWMGRSDRLHNVTLDSGSQWTLTGDTAVESLQVNGSSLALSDGHGFNTLTVAGDLDTTAATFMFNGALQGDDSAIDRLHVRGDARGDAQVVVNNVGGLGAQTLDGIELIRVDGASLARYTLAGRAVAGTYEYFLHKGGVAGGEGNWYLRSELPTTPDPCQVDPSLPGCAPIEPVDPIDPIDPITPPPVLRPEAGVYLANQSAALGMFSHRLGDRLGSVDTGEARNTWARVGRSQADFTGVGGQLSVDGNTSALQIGSDLVRGGNAVFGVMLGSGRSDSTVVSGLTGYSAKGRVRGSAVGVYGTFRQQPGSLTGAYLDASVQMGRFDNRVQGIGLAPEHYDSRMASASLEAGYTFNVWQGAASALYVQPQLQLSHVDFRADRHVERNGTVIDHADAGGLSGRLGVRVFGHGTVAGNTVQPYLAVNWLRGSGTSTLQFNGDRLGADVPRNRYEMQAGAELKLGQRWGAWGGVSVQRGDGGYRNVGGQVGLRMAW